VSLRKFKNFLRRSDSKWGKKGLDRNNLQIISTTTSGLWQVHGGSPKTVKGGGPGGMRLGTCEKKRRMDIE